MSAPSLARLHEDYMRTAAVLVKILRSVAKHEIDPEEAAHILLKGFDAEIGSQLFSRHHGTYVLSEEVKQEIYINGGRRLLGTTKWIARMHSYDPIWEAETSTIKKGA